MRDLFGEYTPLQSSELAEIWEVGLIFLDANVLLNLYRLTQAAQDEFLTLLEDERVIGRVWLPYWAALEFHRNRAGVITEQGASYQRITAIIDKHIRNLVEEMQQVQLHRNHPFISKDEVTAATTALRDALLAELQSKALAYPNYLSEDPILERVHQLFSGKLGLEPTTAEIQKYSAEGEERFKGKIPPGYLDEAKDGIAKYGDYIIWKEILAQAKAADRPGIVVTDDAKEDWWYRLKGRTIGPRPELRREFKRTTGKEFLLYTSTEFAKRAKDYLGRDATLEEFLRQVEWLNLSASIQRTRAETRPRTGEPHVTEEMKYFEHEENEEEEEDDDTASIDEMIEWFYDNFEDPANGVPYESREGGYQYYNGGPHDPLEVLQDEFPDVPFERAEKAAQVIYRDGYDWVRKGDY